MPLVLGKDITKILLRLNKAKTIPEKLKNILSIKPGYLKPISGLMLGLTDPVCGLNMGQTAEVLAKEFGITRKEQDEYALMSHQRAVSARAKLKEEIVAYSLPPKFDKVIEDDNGPRENQNMEALAKLKTIFDRYTGTVTAGNACQVTDGACALLIMDEERARQMGYEPLGYIRAYSYVGLSPAKMGLGPAYAIPTVLNKAGLRLRDMEFIEINEAFAVQVLASLKLLASKEFAKENSFPEEVVGKIDIDRLNVNGGAIALGHPVGVTGSRLILTLLKEMKRRGAELGLASLCVGGGQGGAVVLER
jgi:acetyl-CoA acetyltransferase family protein